MREWRLLWPGGDGAFAMFYRTAVRRLASTDSHRTNTNRPEKPANPTPNRLPSNQISSWWLRADGSTGMAGCPGDTSRMCCAGRAAHGQQGPLFAQLGWNVVVVDLSREQLDRDGRIGAERGLSIEIVEADVGAPWSTAIDGETVELVRCIHGVGDLLGNFCAAGFAVQRVAEHHHEGNGAQRPGQAAHRAAFLPPLLTVLARR